ncbi:biotin-dependent carboxylase-like protein [Herbaspirillum sp. CF444]|uniref:5-oxoprolinase subunit C family protein n=1 Tax=Herbaspirillum sp. CF444 TaxID=1144319 RepID=UPI00027251FE|nr:biotin-dependent carboxyltransferase family protein [Herbaspirillum sp. CF444]EJL86767.1 biotin-dependent carboxylase-like protein [Herbaspirillum sp. CF444]
MIEILATGALSTVQDLGREGSLRFGVGTSGAMDDLALAIGNILLGNDGNAAAIEVPILPFKLRFLDDTDFALTGANCDARLDAQEIPPWWCLHASKGQVLTLGVPQSDARAYLCLAGGIDVAEVLGSRSTQMRGNFGGLEGRPLKKGDLLRSVARAPGATPRSAISLHGFGVRPPAFGLPLHAAGQDGATATAVRVLPAGEYESYTDASLEQFWQACWQVTPQSDRYGYRLKGPVLAARSVIEKRSHGIVPGVIQVPQSGQPIIQLRDAQPSGGYPKIGTVIEADLWRLGQTRIGESIRFLQVSYQEAVAAEEEKQRYLAQLSQAVQLQRKAHS